MPAADSAVVSAEEAPVAGEAEDSEEVSADSAVAVSQAEEPAEAGKPYLIVFRLGFLPHPE